MSVGEPVLVIEESAIRETIKTTVQMRMTNTIVESNSQASDYVYHGQYGSFKAVFYFVDDIEFIARNFRNNTFSCYNNNANTLADKQEMPMRLL